MSHRARQAVVGIPNEREDFGTPKLADGVVHPRLLAVRSMGHREARPRVNNLARCRTRAKFGAETSAMGRARPDSRAVGQEEIQSIRLTFDTVVPYCLVYLKSHGKVLLIRKSKGRPFEGEWIGLGGRLEPCEDPVSSAVREFSEESGLLLADPKLRGTFIWIDETTCGIVHIVTGTRYSGLMSESEEGELGWHRFQDLAALDNLARSQQLFLDKVLLDDDDFYSGIAIYQNNEMVDYVENERPVERR